MFCYLFLIFGNACRNSSYGFPFGKEAALSLSIDSIGRGSIIDMNSSKPHGIWLAYSICRSSITSLRKVGRFGGMELTRATPGVSIPKSSLCPELIPLFSEFTSTDKFFVPFSDGNILRWSETFDSSEEEELLPHSLSPVYIEKSSR